MREFVGVLKASMKKTWDILLLAVFFCIISCVLAMAVITLSKYSVPGFNFWLMFLEATRFIWPFGLGLFLAGTIFLIIFPKTAGIVLQELKSLAGYRFFACILISVLILGTAYPALGRQKERMIKFQSAVYPLSFEYPANWEFDGYDKSYLLTLYTPEAKEHREETLDLVSGLKIEVYLNETDKEIGGIIKRSEGKKVGNYYVSEDRECIYLFTWLKTNKGNVLVIGYIPEKNKKELYLKLYLKFVDSVRFTPPPKKEEIIV